MKQVRVPCGEERSQFTVIYEALREFYEQFEREESTSWPGCLPRWRRTKTPYPHEFLKSQ